MNGPNGMRMTTLGTLDSTLLILVGVICLVLIAVALFRRAVWRSATARDLTREQRARLREQREVCRTMDELLVQLEEASRRISAQVDTQFERLRAAIRDADERINRLERGRPVHRPAAPPPSQPVEEFRPGLPAPPPTAPPAAPAPAAVTRAAVSAVVPTAPPAAATPPPPTPADERRQRIYELADAGMSLVTIADVLQIPVGEVELILSLRTFTNT